MTKLQSFFNSPEKSRMITVICALVGEKGSEFPIDIDAVKTVGHLKDDIKTKNQNNHKSVDAPDLKVFLAKKGDGTWLEARSDHVKKMRKGELTSLIQALTYEDKELDGASLLEDVLDGMPELGKEHIHFLVVTPSLVPDENGKTTPPVHPSEERKRRFDELNRLLSAAEIKPFKSTNKKAKLSSNFSSITWETVKPLFSISITPYVQAEQQIPDELLGELKKYYARLKQCVPLENCTEVTLNMLIAPVLVQVCSLFDGGIQIYAEETLKGDYVKAKGRFEFVLKHGHKSIYIVGAKRENIIDGAAQELVGAEVAAEVGKLDVVYGIVTSFKEWVFYKSSNNKIEKDDTLTFFSANALLPIATILEKATAKIYAMLLDVVNEE